MSRRSQASADVWSVRLLAAGERALWRIGPLAIWLERTEIEWRLAWLREPDHAELASRRCFETGVEPPPAEAETVRFVLRKTGERVRMSPVVPDRSLVVSPRTPVLVPSGEEATLFVSAPVWIDVLVEESARLLRQIAAARPSDTWFGSVLDGELSYALLTHGRSRLEEMPEATHRAITPMRIHNQADEPLELDQVNLTVPFLSLFRGERGRLWTEAVVLRREEAGEMARLEVRPGPPVEAGEAELVHEPRSRAERGRLVRAFNSWILPSRREG